MPATDQFGGVAIDDSPTDEFGGVPVAESNTDEFGGVVIPTDDKTLKPSSSLLRRAIADPFISLGKGIIGVPEAAVGLLDIPTGGRVGKAMELGGYGFQPKIAKDFLDEFLSPEQQTANAKVQAAKGFAGTLQASLENPSTIGHSIIESVPQMLGGGAVARGIRLASKLAKIGTAGKIIAGAAGEGAVAAGSAAESTRQRSKDGLLTPKQSALAVTTGLTTAALSLIGGRVAKRLGIDDPDMLVAGVRSKAARDNIAKRVSKAFVAEGLLEEAPQSALEQIQSNIANGKPWSEGVAESAAQGLLTGGVMGGAVNLPSGGGDSDQPQRAPDGTPILPAAQQANRQLAEQGGLKIDLPALPESAIPPTETVESVALDPATGQPIPSSAQVTLDKAQQRLADIQAQSASPTKPVEMAAPVVEPKPDEAVKASETVNPDDALINREGEVEKLSVADQRKLDHPAGMEYGMTLTDADVPRLQGLYDSAYAKAKAGIQKLMEAMKSKASPDVIKQLDEEQTGLHGIANFYGGALIGASRGKHPISGTNWSGFIAKRKAAGKPMPSSEPQGAGQPQAAVNNSPVVGGQPVVPEKAKVESGRGLGAKLRQRLEAGENLRNEAGGGQLHAMVIDFGRTLYQKGMSFAQWSARMIKELGRKVSPYLKAAWEMLLVETPKDGTILLGSGVEPKGAKVIREKLAALLNPERKATRGKFFTGEYEPTNRKQQVVSAVDFIKDKSDEQVVSELGSFAGGNSVPGLSAVNNTAVVVGTMQRVFDRISKSKNPIEVDALWQLMDRLAKLSQQEGSVTAQTLEARKLIGEELGYMAPVLAFRGLVQKAWAKALGLQPGETAEGVTKGITKKAAQEAIKSPAIEKLLRQAAKEEGINWSQLFLDNDQATQAERRAHLLEHIRKHPALQNLSKAQSLALEKALSDAWENERLKIFRREFAKRIKLPTTQAEQNVFKKVLPELIRQANLGTLTDEAFRNAIAKELGLPSLSSETATKLMKLAQQAQAVPEGVRRNKILQQMVDVIQQNTPANPYDILRDFWYNNALSGSRTLTAILTGSWIHGAIMATQQAADAAIKRQPKAAVRILHAFLSDTLEGIANGWDVFRTGDYTRRAEFADNINAMLSGKGRLDSLEGWLKHGNLWQRALGLTSMVRRAVVGLDYVGAIAARGSGVIYNAMLDNPKQLEAALQRFNKKAAAQAKIQARAEMGSGAKWVDVRARQLEILEEGINQQTKDNAKVLGEIAALNAVPVGMGGAVHKVIQRLPFIGKATLGLAFARAAINMTQNASNWMPLVGGVNWARGLAGKRLPENHWARRFALLDAKGQPLSDDRRRLIAAAQISGLALTTLAYAMTRSGGDDDDDKKIFDVSGSWHTLTPQQKKDRMATGERPLSFRVKGRWYRYDNLPAAGALAVVGNLRDKERKDGKRMAGDDAVQRVSDAWASGLFYMKDLSMVSGLSQMLGVSAMNTDEGVSALNRVLAQQARTAGALIPFSSQLREIDTYFDPKVYKAGSGMDSWIRGIPFVRRMTGEGPEYNMAGLPVENRLTPQSRIVAAKVKPDPVVDALSSLMAKGVFPHHPDLSPTWVKDGEQKSAKDLPGPSYRYQVETLKRWREVMLQDAADIKQFTPEEYEDYFKNHLAPIRDRVKAEIQDEIDPEALNARGKIKKGYFQK